MPLWMPPLGGGSITTSSGSPYTVNTTDATTTSLAVITLGANQRVLFTAYVKATRTGGAAGAAGDVAGYVVHAMCQTIASVAEVVGQTAALNAEDQDWAAVFDATGATIRIRVTGAANNNITWEAVVLQY